MYRRTVEKESRVQIKRADAIGLLAREYVILARTQWFITGFDPLGTNTGLAYQNYLASTVPF